MTRSQKVATLVSALGIAAAALHQARRRRACDFRGRSVLVTGGSRGLGLLVARRFLEEGADVTITARNGDELARAQELLATTGGTLTCLVGDVGSRGGAQDMVRQVVERTGRIDALVNNAGVIKVGPLAHMERADFEEAMAVHFWGPLEAILTALPTMQQQQFGRIVNISSLGGQIGVPHLTPYCASKFALVGLSDSIRAEIARDGIRVTTVTPGLMRTGSPFNAWFKGKHRDEFAWFTIADSLPGMSVGGEAAAEAVLDACRHGDAHRAIGWPAVLAPIGNAVVPGAVAAISAAVNTYLLPSDADTGARAHSGWQSISKWAPSTLTRLTERAARDNNEIPGDSHAHDLAH